MTGLYAAKLRADRASHFGETFTAWLVPTTAARVSQPLNVAQASTIEEAAQLAAVQCVHKDHFSVLQHDHVSGKKIEHVFYVKQKTARWISDPETGAPKQVRPLEAELRFSREVTAFQLVEPWQWTPGCDVVGIDSVVKVQP